MRYLLFCKITHYNFCALNFFGIRFCMHANFLMWIRTYLVKWDQDLRLLIIIRIPDIWLTKLFGQRTFSSPFVKRQVTEWTAINLVAVWITVCTLNGDLNNDLLSEQSPENRVPWLDYFQPFEDQTSLLLRSPLFFW